ncbi:hypothetical protein Vi05172_g9012 [Venturia inaequalis]|nr:hypothetical protein Vi05172_g9012 [Venturia inaequalis]
MKNILLPLSLQLLTAYAQNTSTITIPATNGSIPAGAQNGCAAGYYPSTDTVLYTLPYTYPQVLSIIGNYTNLTWSGSPDNSVTSNSTTWVPGTARFYSLAGAYVIETITEYSKPDSGPYIEIHTLAPLTIAAANVSFYAAYDAQNWTSVCDGKATTANFTVGMCATNATAAAALLHSIHLTDARTVGSLLGGRNFTTCQALGSNATTPNTTTPASGGSATGLGGAAGSTASGAASGLDASKVTGLSSVVLVLLGAMML